MVVGLCALQGASLWAGWAGAGRVADWVALLCPAGVLALTLGRMSPGSDWRPIETAFLAMNLACLGLALVLLWSGAAAPVAARWGLWAVNSLSCAILVYLAFFFRLF